MCVSRWTCRGEKEQADGKVRREPGEKHRWRMSHVISCVEWQAQTWTDDTAWPSSTIVCTNPYTAKNEHG